MSDIKVLSDAEVDELFDTANDKDREIELKNFTKCIANNYQRLKAICEVYAIDAGARGWDGGCCQPVGRQKCQEILHDVYELLLSGKMKVNGKVNNWSNGCFGSRWFDMDAEKYGVDYIRGAFYSKKNYKHEWTSEKPYLIQVIIEKARDDSDSE